MGEQPDISNAEWQVMNAVWDGQPVTAGELIKVLGPANGWSAATVRTFLHRLVKKGALQFEQDGNRYLYSAAISRHRSVKQASRSFLSSVFGGETGSLVTHFVKSGKLTSEEIDELRRLLQEKESR